MIKRITFLIGILMICFGIQSMECEAAAADPSRSCSLTIEYSKNEAAFPDLEIEIYRVAELCADGEYRLLQPFSEYPIRIQGISSQQEWQETAQTINSYVTANQVPAYQSQKTNTAGVVIFENLETGLYMIKGIVAKNEFGTVLFQDFMMYLPTPIENDFDYDMEAKPKSTEYVQAEKYTVVKLWKDSKISDKRPESVCVDILKDGVVQESVILNDSNNWSYSWEVLEEGGSWSVIEKDVSDDYQVSITNNKTTFIITNSDKPSDDPGDPGDPPPSVKTGDTAPFFMYMIILCVAGFGLIILGILRLRDRNDEKKR